MFRKLHFDRPFGIFPVVATTVAVLMFFATTADVMGQDQDTPRPGASQGEADEGSRDGDEQKGPQLGVVVAASPGGSPLVLRVMAGSPADQAGIRHGDYILSLDGKKIKSPEHLQKTLKQMQSTEKASVTIWRNGEEQSHEVHLAAQERPREKRLVRRAWLGAMIRAAGDVGVEIARIYLDSPADKAGLQAGDRVTQIDGEDVSSPQTLTERIRRLEPGTKVDIVVDRDGEEMTVEVEVGNLEDFHERLFGKRFRRKFDDFHELFDPDFDGVPEGVFSFRIPSGEDDELPLRELLREMRKELREFRQEFRDSNGDDRGSSNEKDTESSTEG